MKCCSNIFHIPGGEQDGEFEDIRQQTADMYTKILIRNVSRYFCVLGHRNPHGTPNLYTRNLSSNANILDCDTKVVCADDGRTVVCWHPEPPFPYEYSLPLPENSKTESILKAMDIEDKFKGLKEEFVREELMKMTFTTKHRWFPRARDKKAKKTPMDRPYL